MRLKIFKRGERGRDSIKLLCVSSIAADLAIRFMFGSSNRFAVERLILNNLCCYNGLSASERDMYV